MIFPQVDVYATLFPKKVQRMIGVVGAETRPVQRMLERVGFRYVERIDPFDGGPHFECPTADVAPIRAYRKVLVAKEPLEHDFEAWLVAADTGRGANRFRAVRTPCRIDGDQAFLPHEVRKLLRVTTGDVIHAIPFER